MGLKYVLPISLVLCLFSFNVNCDNTTTTTATPTTTPTPQQVCSLRSGKTCEECLDGNAKCYYCNKDKKCSYFNSVIPYHEDCGSLATVRWLTCKIDFQALIIGVSVVGGLLLIGLTVCCCCCCRKRKNSIWAKDQVKWDRQREEVKMRSDDRRRERQSRTDEIRRKYGLMKGDNNYQRFDA